jgi:CubicO group peptidase (beta-lactamase class C family)
MLSAPADHLEACIKQQMQAQNIPGLVIHVRRGKQTVLRKAYGYSNLEKRSATKISDRFEMGSIGKSFTASLILKFAERGLVSLDDSVRKHLPDVPAMWSQVKIKNLLSQTSGLPDYAFQEKLAYDQAYTRQDWQSIMFGQNLEFRPGQIFAYSNTNFVLLGLIIERITKKPYIDAIKEELFVPLKMSTVEFRKGNEGVQPRADGYYKEEAKLDPAGAGIGTPVPSDGGAFCTVDDLFRYGDAFLAGKIVSPVWVKRATRPFRSHGREFAYGFGWFVRQESGVRVVEHDGNGIGYSASLSYYPKQDVSIAVMCNVYPVIASDLARTLAATLSPALQEPRLIAAAKDPHPDTTRWLLEALKTLAAGKLDSPKFHADLVATYSTGRGKLALGAMDRFKVQDRLRYVDERRVGPDRMLRYLLNDSAQIRFFLEPGGKLIKLQSRKNPH